MLSYTSGVNYIWRKLFTDEEIHKVSSLYISIIIEKVNVKIS